MPHFLSSSVEPSDNLPDLCKAIFNFIPKNDKATPSRLFKSFAALELKLITGFVRRVSVHAAISVRDDDGGVNEVYSSTF